MPSRRTFLATVAAGATLTRAPDSTRATESAAPDTAWARTYAGGAGFADLRTVVPSTDGYVLAGVAGEEDTRGFAVRTDAAGRPRWRRTLGSSAGYFNAGAAHPDGGVVLAGTTNVRERGPTVDRPLSSDPWLVRLDEAGDLVWTRTLQPAAGAGGVDALSRAADGYLVAGRRQSDEDDRSRPWVAHVSSAGHRRWARTVGDATRKGWLNAASTAGDAWYVGGSTTPVAGGGAGEGEAALVVRLGPDGTARWRYAPDEPKGSRVEALHADGAGVVVAGNRRFASDDDGRGWHFRLTADGSVDWRRSHSTGPWNWLHGLAPLDDGYLLVGTRERATAETNGPRGAWVLRTGPTGRPHWETTYFDGEFSSGDAIRALDGGAFLVAGRTETDDGEAGWLLNAGGSEPSGRPSPSDRIADVAERIPPDADAIGLGALLGAGAVAAGRRLLGDD